MAQNENVLVAIQILIGVVGVAGNGSVCLVVRKLASQRGGGNVNILIVYQACIDLVTSILLLSTALFKLFPSPAPPQIIGIGTLYCIFWHYRVIMWCTFVMSTFNLLIITLERYIAVLHPIWYIHHFSRKVATGLILVAWLIAPLMQLVNGFTQLGFSDGKCTFFPQPRSVLAAQDAALFLWEYIWVKSEQP